MAEGTDNPKLSAAVELFSVGDVTNATRLLLEALVSHPGDPAVLSHLRYMEKLSPDSLQQVEQDLGMSVEHVLSRTREPIEVELGARDYIYYGLPPHWCEDTHESQNVTIDIHVGEPTVESESPSAPPEITQPSVPIPPVPQHSDLGWDVDTGPFNADDILASGVEAPIAVPGDITLAVPALAGPSESGIFQSDTEDDLSALIIDAADTEDFDGADGDATTSEFKTQGHSVLIPDSLGAESSQFDTDPAPDMLDGWGAAEPHEEADDISTTGITLIEAVSETDEYALGDEAGVRLRALETRLKQFLELDDLTDALEVVHEILSVDADHVLASQARDTCVEKLIHMYESKVGGELQAIPEVLLPPDQLVWQDLDHRAGFILSQVDGASSFNDIILISGMERLDTMRILAHLVQDGVIGVN